jgi:hypothetical protein
VLWLIILAVKSGYEPCSWRQESDEKLHTNARAKVHDGTLADEPASLTLLRCPTSSVRNRPYLGR